MKLVYHKGKNFGDALNPYILDELFPDFFDEDLSDVFLGIGSIIGLKQHYKQKKIVFSSGFAAGNESTYGSIPKIDQTWDIRCVRGPLTADILKLNKKLAVADGAILLSMLNILPVVKKFTYSFMPHHTSFKMYSQWAALMNSCDVHLIDPRDDVNKILQEINASEFLISEAMHGAIVADALRIPWLGVKVYPYINDFKWNDWAASLNMKADLLNLSTLHDFDFLKMVIKNKSNSLIPDFALDKLTSYILKNREKRFLKKIKEIKESKFSLSKENILKSKCDQLQNIAREIITDYR